ncbi:MBL fold metallo-hydrolase [Shewanella sedimentimangrovi]|uniref:Metallo-beta-lactamase domain-containing protein n=1 Tax=Shewanella sedimentimangrovi TaxID=2814293 RepID=A0ABX7R3S4_9GAMM|nr:hypothetical protein [Shewanella sedimentimangrovi]QSX37942.1 hypothetical protein JYB85_03620 [Shewanella sedimentimangrovi]
MKGMHCVLSLMLIGTAHAGVLEIDDAQFEVNRLSDNLYVVGQDYGSSKINFGVLVDDKGVILISSMMANYAPTIEKVVHNLSDKPIKYVLNPDSDPFHHDANGYFAERGATIIAQENMGAAGAFTQVTFDHGLTLNLGDEIISLVHTPAHTRASSLIKLHKNNVIFTGDAFRNDWLMYSGPNGPKAEIQGLDQAIALADKDTRFIPGNRSARAFSTLEELKKSRDTYQQFAAFVLGMRDRGVAVEDIIASAELKQLVSGLERFDDWQDNIQYHVKDVLALN